MNGENRDDDRPYDPRTKKPIGPLRQPGYYPDFSTLAQQKFWDAKTREVILDRVHNIPPIRFFAPVAVKLLEVICDRIIPQDDRDARIKFRLFLGSISGCTKTATTATGSQTCRLTARPFG